ncbi:MAG: hypothetical protein NVS2B3_16700 [Vulcanimicrobiaceae bacterium]
MHASGVGLSPRQRIDAWMNLGASIARANDASLTTALALSPSLVGYVAQQLAANRRVPMVVVEGAHLMHDLSIAIADANTALLEAALLPYRLFKPRVVEARRSS